MEPAEPLARSMAAATTSSLSPPLSANAGRERQLSATRRAQGQESTSAIEGNSANGTMPVAIPRGQEAALDAAVANSIQPHAPETATAADTRSFLPGASPMSISPDGAPAAGSPSLRASPQPSPRYRPSSRLPAHSGTSSSLVPPFPANTGSPHRHQHIAGQETPVGYAAEPASTSDDMIKMASQAGLHLVSSALATQAPPQATHFAEALPEPQQPAAATKMTFASTMPPSTPAALGHIQQATRNAGRTADGGHSPGLRRGSLEEEQHQSYTALLNAHMASALHGARRMSAISARNEPAPSTTAAAAQAAQVHMATIATQVASEESEKQLRLQALLKASGHASIITSQLRAVKGLPSETDKESREDAHLSSSATQPPSIGDSHHNTVPSQMQTSIHHHQHPHSSAALYPPKPSSASERMRASGLAHIEMPSRGVEQAWGRVDDGTLPEADGEPSSNAAEPAASSKKGRVLPLMSKFYNPSDAMAGVPSLPLMPAPPLVMLPPPAAPGMTLSFAGEPSVQAAGKQNGSLTSYARPLNYTEATEAPRPEAVAALMSDRPALDVIQTPNGTAKAGWWIPREQAQGTSSDNGNGHSAYVEEGRAKNQASSVSPASPALFQTSCIVDQDTYAALATQAAYATSLLTTSSSAAAQDAVTQQPQPTPSAAGPGRRQQPLVAEQYEAMKNQLTAWAGLHGPALQAEAQQLLEARKINILTGVDAPPQVAAGELADPTDPSQASLFFPPDFASHFQAQLQALTSGVYKKKYQEAINRDRTLDVDISSVDPSEEMFGDIGATSPGEQTQNGTHANSLRDAASAAGHLEAAISQRAKSLGLSRDAVSVVMDHAAPPRAPVPSAETHDPMQLVSVASSETGAHAHSEVVLDKLLRLAHQLYQTGGRTEKTADGTLKHTMHPTLLALLHTLHNMHPNHLPTLLLLSCAYYSDGDYPASLFWNDRILNIDPGYVEAMSNIGTTLRALGRWKEAESWWFRAVKLKPGYWDAFENLLGVLCSPQRLDGASGASAGNHDQATQQAPPRFREALRLCEHVESHVMHKKSWSKHMAHKTPHASTRDMPTYLPFQLPASGVPRLQQLFWAKGNAKYILAESAVPAAEEYKKVIELVISPSERQAYTVRDLIVATCILGYLSLGASLGQPAAASGALQIMAAMKVDCHDPKTLELVAQAHWSKICPGGLLSLVHAAGDELVKTLLKLGGGSLPTVMLKPDHTLKLANALFQDFGGYPPSLITAARSHGETNFNKALQMSNQTTSTTLLTLAKLFQDATANPVPSQHGVLSLDGIPASISLVLPLYYLSLALCPSASTCNNLGILLSTLPIKMKKVDEAGRVIDINGQAMALEYYTAGISMDSKHPHLYTNLGSLLKDLGHHQEAIAQYEKAIAIRGTFDVALANLANSLRDIGRTEASLPYYRRALEANPNAKMPEAMCGLLNGLLHLADWRETFCEGGLLSQVVELVEKQLNDGASYGAGAIQSSASVQDWVHYIAQCLGESRREVLSIWFNRLAIFFSQLDRATLKMNEGGFLLRLIEYLHKRSQHRWYEDLYGKVASVEASDTRMLAQIAQARSTMGAQASKYPRTRLPPALMIAPAVPTVLPFHTFSYGIEGTMSPRAIRLISHRNALRISQSSLSQSWLPSYVYPPPPPPSPKINIGYVSSDFNNHPLAHLMQSTFGFHDLSRFNVFLYATTPSDNSPYRKKIESEAQNFLDVSHRSTEQIVNQIVHDGIHILMNLNGYTKGARNEVFAARPCPVQMHFMGFAGGMASGWTDYVIADTVVCPPEVTSVDTWNQRRKSGEAGRSMVGRPTDLPGEIDPEEPSDAWMYTERFIYMPHSYFVNDHKQGFREPETRRSDTDGSVVHPYEMTLEEAWAEEEERRWKARKELFPGLPDDFVVFATFNQFYKMEPVVFESWLEILKQVPNSILWLLRFPAEGEPNLMQTARDWAGDEVASRLVFTDVAPKEEHVRRGRVADLILDTFEVNAHTTACDCLWSGTPILTLPKWKWKQASLVAASIAKATGYGDQMIVDSVEQYVSRAVELAKSVEYTYVDTEGKALQAVPPTQPIKASELLRLGASAKLAAKVQQQAATTGPQGQQNPLLPNGLQGVLSQGGQPKSDHQAVAAVPPSVVPAPVTVQQQSSSQASKSALEAASPDRNSMILKQVGPQAPPGAVSRHGSGELVELRRKLFTTRDTSPLFDTQQWMRDLEKGYTEAWRRWSLGVDKEESVEWDALSEEEKEQNSGHIYVDRL